jgi:hypothetical protein
MLISISPKGVVGYRTRELRLQRVGVGGVPNGRARAVTIRNFQQQPHTILFPSCMSKGGVFEYSKTCGTFTTKADEEQQRPLGCATSRSCYGTTTDYSDCRPPHPTVKMVGKEDDVE